MAPLPESLSDSFFLNQVVQGLNGGQGSTAIPRVQFHREAARFNRRVFSGPHAGLTRV